MSATDGVGREIAYRLFAAEYDDASLSYAESDEERAPNYVVTPTGARVNRVFVVGTLTEVSAVNDEMVRARVVDPTGAYVVYAGQYQPDQLAFLERAEPPAFVAVTGKARTFEPDDGDRVYTSVRPESIATVDADTRDRWVVGAAEQTLDRIAAYAGAAELDADGETLTAALVENGVAEALAKGIPLAQDHYGTTPAYLEALRERALEAVRVVAGERDQVEPLDFTPSDAGRDETSFAALAEAGGVSYTLPPDLAGGSREGDAATGDDAAIDDDAATGEAGESTVTTAADVGEAETSSGAAVGTAGADTDSEPAETEPAETEPDADAPAAEAVADFDDDATGEDETVGGGEATDGADEATGSDESAADASETVASEDGADAAVTDEDDEDDLGDFESGGLSDELYEMDDEEREEIEEEFGTEFTTGAAVDETPEGAEPEDDGSTSGVGTEAPAAEADTTVEAAATESENEVSGDGTDEPVDDEAASDAVSEDQTEDEPVDDEPASDDVDDEPIDDVDLQDRVVETMSELDDGDGAERGAVVDAVTDETGASADDVEDAIQDALMGGQCYEPDDETLKAI